MKKKIISLIFASRVTETLIKNLTRDLRLVFDDTIEIRTVYTDDLTENEQIAGDALLIMYPGVIKRLKHHVSDLKKVISVTRTVTEDTIYRIYDIPKGSTVLVVNDTPETTADTVSMLYQLGIEHLNMIPYSAGETDITDIQVAITPGEARRVPAEIPNVIDIGDRRLDMQTFLDIITLLNLGTDKIKQALIRYADTTLELHTGIKTRYITSYRLNEMLSQILSLQNSGIIVTDADFHINYWNAEAERILEKRPKNQTNLSLYFLPETLKKLTSPDFIDDLISVGGRSFMVTRTTLNAMDCVSGYYLKFESAAQIRKSGSELSSKLKSQGLIARYTFEDIVYHSPAMESCINMAKKVAGSDYTILITGETGTGKEMFAQAIHNYSPRRNKPFVAINCAALPEALLESELFGYEEGAFTGAKRGGKMGLFEQADGGTIFLDEIGDMPYSLQSKLLRVLQEQQIVRVGGRNVININVRILTATNQDLQEMIHERKFREDLFYRLNVFPLRLISLRERKEDIVPLFCGFGNFSEQEVDQEHVQKLKAYSWPGNVRELKNAAEYYKLMENLDCLQMPENSDREAKRTGTPPVPEKQPRRIPMDALKNDILEIIMSREEEGLSSGRHSLMNDLKMRNRIVSEGRLERALCELQERGLIVRKKGRGGITLV